MNVFGKVSSEMNSDT